MKQVLLWLIRVYQVVLSPLLGPRFRYYPTCSRYALLAVRQYGAGVGGWLAFRRVLRCHPWGGSGYDPVPRLFRHLKFYPCAVPCGRVPYRRAVIEPGSGIQHG